MTFRSHAVPALLVLAQLALAACGGPDRSRATRHPPAAPLPTRAADVSGFRRPEAAAYDSAADVFFVSNGGDSVGLGFISRVRPDGAIDSLRFIAGGRGGVTLRSPRGMTIVGDTLWVADDDAVRGFDARSGAPLAVISLAAEHAHRLDAVAAGPDGALYVTDAGTREEQGAHVPVPGAARIFRIAHGHKVSVALASAALAQPRGIIWDRRGRRFVIVLFDASTILAWRPADSAAQVIGYNSRGMDGVGILPDGRMVVTSWQDSALTVRAGAGLTLVKGFPAPGGIGVDTRRGRVAVPLAGENRLEIWTVPSAKPSTRAANALRR